MCRRSRPSPRERRSCAEGTAGGDLHTHARDPGADDEDIHVLGRRCGRPARPRRRQTHSASWLSQPTAASVPPVPSIVICVRASRQGPPTPIRHVVSEAAGRGTVGSHRVVLGYSDRRDRKPSGDAKAVPSARSRSSVFTTVSRVSHAPCRTTRLLVLIASWLVELFDDERGGEAGSPGRFDVGMLTGVLQRDLPLQDQSIGVRHQLADVSPELDVQLVGSAGLATTTEAEHGEGCGASGVRPRG